MQSLEIDGLKEVIQTLETTPEVIRQVKDDFFNSLENVRREDFEDSSTTSTHTLISSSRLPAYRSHTLVAGKAMWPSGLWQRLIWMATQRVILPMRWKTAML